MKKPTIKTARKIIKLLSHGLVLGMGRPVPGKMCVEAAVCYAMGLPHSDEPSCVSSAVRAFKIGLNDANWSSNKARAQGLKKLAIAQLGSDSIDEQLFVQTLVLKVVNEFLPIFLRGKIPDELCENCKNAKTLDDAADAADTAADTAAARAARAARVAHAADTADAADVVLNQFADFALHALQVCKSPGCKWLYLCDEKEVA